MKVSEVIEALKKMDQEAIVITAADEEGNGFRIVPNGWVTPGWIEGGEFYPETDNEEENNEVSLLGEICVCIG